MEPAGRDPGRAFGAPAVGPVTLCSQKKSSPFWTIFSPAWGMGPWTMPSSRRWRHAATLLTLATGTQPPFILSSLSCASVYHFCIEPRFQHQLGAVLVLQMNRGD